MTTNNNVGPFLRTQDAALHCGYSYDRFRLLARKHQIPRHGPSHTRFAVSDLDQFMLDPNCFVDNPKELPSKKRKIKLVA
jgi:hypothetical protein